MCGTLSHWEMESQYKTRLMGHCSMQCPGLLPPTISFWRSSMCLASGGRPWLSRPQGWLAGSWAGPTWVSSWSAWLKLRSDNVGGSEIGIPTAFWLLNLILNGPACLKMRDQPPHTHIFACAHYWVFIAEGLAARRPQKQATYHHPALALPSWLKGTPICPGLCQLESGWLGL